MNIHLTGEQTITGDQLIKTYKMKPIDLLHIISESGLQPYDNDGNPIPPPDVKKIKRAMLSIDLDNPQPSRFRLSMSPVECLGEIEKQRGDDKTWRGFDFDDCVGELIFDTGERVKIIKALASNETLFLQGEVTKCMRKPRENGRESAKAKHDRESRIKCQNYAWTAWRIEKRKLNVDEFVQEIIDRKLVSPMSNKTGKKSYSSGKIRQWVSGIQTGKKGPPFR